MSGLRYSVAPIRSLGYSDVLILRPGEDAASALGESIMDALAIDIMVTIAGETRHLAAWLDPDHWSDDYDPEVTARALAAAGIEDDRQ